MCKIMPTVVLGATGGVPCWHHCVSWSFVLNRTAKVALGAHSRSQHSRQQARTMLASNGFGAASSELRLGHLDGVLVPDV